MKKFIIGLICGIVLAVSPFVYASETIQAYLFPVKLQINGENQDLNEEYKVLNVDGHAYVPIRFVAERLDGKVKYSGDDNFINISFKSLVKLPSKYPLQSAEQNGDVIYRSSTQVIHFDEFADFIANVEKQQKDWIRVTRYTVEGDPIIQELNYDGKWVNYLYDSSRDAYGSKFIYEARYTNINKKDRINNDGSVYTDYTLEGGLENAESCIILSVKK